MLYKACLLAHLAVFCDDHKFGGLQFLKKWKPLNLIPYVFHTQLLDDFPKRMTLNVNIPYIQGPRKSLLIPKWLVFYDLGNKKNN